MAIISVIVAVAENGAIGRDNNLIWRLPNDLKYFKALTLGHTIIMGSNTFRSLPSGALPGRDNVVLSRSETEFPGAAVYRSIEEAVEAVKDQEEVFIIGGAQIYKQVMAYADKLYVTEVAASFPDADVFFPEIDKSIWREVSRQDNPIDEKHAYAYSFVVYKKGE